jgi:hypothetical protein
MKNIAFNKFSFFTTILLFVVLTAAWTVLCVQYDEFTKGDKGLVSGLGYLLILSFSIFCGIKSKSIANLVLLTVLVILTFLIGSFGLGLALDAVTGSLVVYALVNALFVALVMTLALNKLSGIYFKWFTIGLIFVFLLVAYIIFVNLDDHLHLKYGLQPRLTMFIVFQFLLIVPLALGMALKSEDAGNESQKRT